MRTVALLVLVFMASLAAARENVDLQIIFANDVSNSLTKEAYIVERDGLIAALRDPQIQYQLSHAGSRGQVAVAYFEWANSNFQRVHIPWTILRKKTMHADIEKIISILLANTSEQAQEENGTEPIRRRGVTSIGGALEFIHSSLLPSSPVRADRTVIDVSGDGSHNDGIMPNIPRDLLLEDKNVTINGIVMTGIEKDVYEHYVQYVIGGEMAFALRVPDIESYPAAIRRKLILETASLNQVHNPDLL